MEQCRQCHRARTDGDGVNWIRVDNDGPARCDKPRIASEAKVIVCGFRCLATWAIAANRAAENLANGPVRAMEFTGRQAALDCADVVL